MPKARTLKPIAIDDPERVRVVELAQRVAQPDQLREEEVDADQQREDDDRRLDQPSPREDRQFDGIAAVRRISGDT